MQVWRITRRGYQALDGEGARLYGGRWNREGLALIYTSESLSLAALEYLVHVDPANVPEDLVAMQIEVPNAEALGLVIDADLFEDGSWRDYPAPAWQSEFGDRWVREGSYLWLSVPSTVVPEERNVLINPSHPRMTEVRVLGIRPFGFDRRLL